MSSILDYILGPYTLNINLPSFPNVLSLYFQAFLSLFYKKKFVPYTAKVPEVKAALSEPSEVSLSSLRKFKQLVNWNSSPEHVPSVYLVTENFKLAMTVMMSRAFPVSVLGSVMNKHALYEMYEPVTVGMTLERSCRLSPQLRETPGGHTEFDLILSVVDSKTSRRVWSATLTFVNMNPKKKKREGGSRPSPPKEEEVEYVSADTWKLRESVGREYAALDGDRSPMHMYRATSWMAGFPRPVANVVYMMGRVEAAFAKSLGMDVVTAPFKLEAEFKKPIVLPTTLDFKIAKGATAASKEVAFVVTGSKDALVAVGKLIKG